MASAGAWGPWRGRRRRRVYRWVLVVFAFAFTASFFVLQMAPPSGYVDGGGIDDYDVIHAERENLVRDGGFKNEINRGILQADVVSSLNDEIVGESDEDEDDYDEDNDNPVFREGDFDGVAPQFDSADVSEGETNNDVDYESENLESMNYGSWNAERKLQSQYDGNAELQNFSSPVADVQSNEMDDGSFRLYGKNGTAIVDNVIFWSAEVEQQSPKGFDDEYVDDFRIRVRRLAVASVQPPSWDRCGRPRNQFITLADGTPMCARYRTPHDYLVQGEVMSFYLARLLGIQNVPIVVLSQADWNTHQWKRKKVKQQVKAAGWKPNATVALIQWIHHLERDRMPVLLLDAMRNHINISLKTPQLADLSPEKLSELLQWSDLIIFDYITGNYDRVASMQDAADKEKKPSILSETIHNLVKSKKTNGLWLIDNESGLLDAYSLLYSSSQPNQQGGRFIEFHHQVLQSMCIFRRSTHEKVHWLHHHGDARKLLLDAILKDEPLFANLPEVSNHLEYVHHFQQRIADVYYHTRRCYDQAITSS